MTRIESLKQLLAEATQPEWLNGYYGHHDATGREVIAGYTVEANVPDGEDVVRTMIAETVKSRSDAALIVAMKSAMPALIAIAEAATKVDELRISGFGRYQYLEARDDESEALEAVRTALKAFAKLNEPTQ